MTSKTFKSPLPDSNYKFEIGKNVGAEHLFAWISGGGVDSISMALAPSDAPALALAILEAAGWPNEHLATTEILRRLRELDEHVKAVEAEARELAELEAEALELCNAHRTAVGSPTVASWDGFTSATKSNWLAVARCARELAKEATK